MTETLILVSVLAGQVLLVWFLWRQEKRVREITRFLAGYYTPEGTAEKSLGVLERTMRKARGILGRAETESERYERKLDVAESRMERAFQEEAEGASRAFENYLESLKAKSDKLADAAVLSQKDALSQMLSASEEELATIVRGMQDKLTVDLEEDLVAAKKELAQYRQRRLESIDKEIFALLTRALVLVAGRKISLEDDKDLVYEALEQAKKEKLIE